MDIRELETFIAVCKAGSFTAAARVRGLTQPGVSRHIQRLEQELGTQLFDRSARSLTLTRDGSKLLEYAEEAVAGHRRLLKSLRSDDNLLEGELRVAASSTPGECLLPKLLAEFTTRHPDVQPRLFVADSMAVIEEVVQRQWDLGFTGIRVPAANLKYDVIAQDEVVLAVPDGHPFATRSEVDVTDLDGQPMIEREGGSGTLRWFRNAVMQAGVPSPSYRTVMVLNSAHAILSAVHSGMGLGIISSLEYEQHRFQGVHQVRFSGVPLERDLFMVRLRNRPLSPVAEAFSRWVLEQRTRSAEEAPGRTAQRIEA